MEKLAIIGTGIAGMGCAHFLKDDYEITVFEKDGRVGGHTNTIYIKEEGKNIPIDTGFIVCNNENYPLLMRLFRELKVPLKKTSMSFAAQHIPDGIEYCGSSLRLLFGKKRNFFWPRYLRFLLQLGRFNRECIEVLHDPSFHDISVEEYINKKKYTLDLLNWYILPMCSALWSTPPHTTAKFPVMALVRFFKNHGLLGLNTQYQWFTVDGGSEEYKKRLIAPFRDKIQTNAGVKSLKRILNGVEITLTNGKKEIFDKVILASHADQSLHMLADATHDEKKILSAFHYEKNRAALHTDESIMPRMRKLWSSWNYRVEKKHHELVSSCTYWMNSLQDVSQKKNYFVTINDRGNIHRDKILNEQIYEHPIFTVDAMKMQQQLPELNKNGRLYFCGSYFRYGFHEDAFMSAVSVCEEILQRNVWEKYSPVMSEAV